MQIEFYVILIARKLIVVIMKFLFGPVLPHKPHKITRLTVRVHTIHSIRFPRSGNAFQFVRAHAIHIGAEPFKWVVIVATRAVPQRYCRLQDIVIVSRPLNDVNIIP